MKKSKLKRLLKYIFLSQLNPSPPCKMSPWHILELPRHFGPTLIEIWSWNSSKINTLMLDSRGYMMLPLMVGILMISIGAAIRRDGRWQSLRPPRISYLAASQQLNGNPLMVSVSPTPPPFCSVSMRAKNIPSWAEIEMLYNVGVVSALYLGRVVMS